MLKEIPVVESLEKGELKKIVGGKEGSGDCVSCNPCLGTGNTDWCMMSYFEDKYSSCKAV